ncbi:MAG: hypothetical protein Q8P05_01925 [Candidatus Diapherotrites archaeon]|nr:hypothetical protein [Candidatus Diapherotrites archaeon]MDZ4256949.1 hypothetical protein [archaeon]
MSMDHILVVNSGMSSLLTMREFAWPLQRALQFPSTVVPISKLGKKHVRPARAIIFSGCPVQDFTYEAHVKRLAWLRNVDIPMVGICAGQQFLARLFGARVKARKVPLIGMNLIRKKGNFPFLENVPSSIRVYSLHAKEVTLPSVSSTSPAPFIPLSASSSPPSSSILFKGAFLCFSSPSCPISGFVHPQKRILGLSFHPEVGHPYIIRDFMDWAINNSPLPARTGRK